MRITLLVLLLAVVFTVGFAPAPFPRAERRPGVSGDLILGEWKGPNELRVTADRMDFNGPSGNHYHLTTNPRVKPATFDLKGVAGTGGAGRNYTGIYRVEGETLTICYNSGDQPRPRAFEGDGKGAFTEVYSRVKR